MYFRKGKCVELSIDDIQMARGFASDNTKEWLEMPQGRTVLSFLDDLSAKEQNDFYGKCGEMAFGLMIYKQPNMKTGPQTWQPDFVLEGLKIDIKATSLEYGTIQTPTHHTKEHAHVYVLMYTHDLPRVYFGGCATSSQVIRPNLIRESKKENGKPYYHLPRKYLQAFDLEELTKEFKDDPDRIIHV